MFIISSISFCIRTIIIASFKAVILILYPNLYINKFDFYYLLKCYSETEFGNHLIRNGLLEIIKKIKLIHGENFFARKNYSRIFIALKYFTNSKGYDQYRWLCCTNILTKIDDISIHKFYINAKSLYYSQIEKIAAIDSIRIRCSQFNLFDLSDIKDKSYLEVGGSTGLLPILAALLGFKSSINLEISPTLSAEGLDISKELSLTNYSTITNLKKDVQFDFISCHQVLEHVLDPCSFLNDLRQAMHNESLLFFSHGLDLLPYPGHIKSKMTFTDMLNLNKLVIIDEYTSLGNLFVIKKL